MSFKSKRNSPSAFKKSKRPLPLWEEAALETARKTERLRALRLAKEAGDNEGAASTGGGESAGKVPSDA